jgi:putative transposase
LCGGQAEAIGMDKRTARKTFTYKLAPTPAQAQALERIVWRCRDRYNTALERRRPWWGRGQGVGATSYQQKAELPDLKAVCPGYAAVHAQVVQDVLLRLDRTFQAFFRRVKAGETPGYPRFRGRGRYTSCTYPPYGNGAVLDGGVLSRAKIGRIPVRIHRHSQARPRPLPSPMKRTAGMPASRAPRCPLRHCH